MVFYRKKLQLIYKFLISQLFKIIYGKVFFSNKNDNDIQKKWNNTDFLNLYISKVRSICINIDPSSFLKALKLTIFASSSDDSKQLLTGVNFTFNKKYLESIKDFLDNPKFSMKYFMVMANIRETIFVGYDKSLSASSN